MVLAVVNIRPRCFRSDSWYPSLTTRPHILVSKHIESSSLCGTGLITDSQAGYFTVWHRSHYRQPVWVFHCVAQVSLQTASLGISLCDTGLITDSQSGYFTVWHRSHYRQPVWVFHCVFGFGGDTFYVCWTKVTVGEWSFGSLQTMGTAEGI
jgi:hypothetical protein